MKDLCSKYIKDKFHKQGINIQKLQSNDGINMKKDKKSNNEKY